jgi:hypothetical protein
MIPPDRQFDQDGEFVTAWGETGDGPGELTGGPPTLMTA